MIVAGTLTNKMAPALRKVLSYYTAVLESLYLYLEFQGNQDKHIF